MFEEFHAKKNGLHGLDACVIRREFDIVLALHKFLEFDHWLLRLLQVWKYVKKLTLIRIRPRRIDASWFVQIW